MLLYLHIRGEHFGLYFQQTAHMEILPCPDFRAGTSFDVPIREVLSLYAMLVGHPGAPRAFPDILVSESPLNFIPTGIMALFWHRQ